MAADETAVDYVECPAVEFIERTPIGRMPPSIYIDDTYRPAEKRRVLITDKHDPAFFDSTTCSLITTTYQDRIRLIHNRMIDSMLLSLLWLCIGNLFVAWLSGLFDADNWEDDDNSNDDEELDWLDVLIIIILLSVWISTVCMMALAGIRNYNTTRSALQEMNTELSQNVDLQYLASS
jgi:hypothetical protein